MCGVFYWDTTLFSNNMLSRAALISLFLVLFGIIVPLIKCQGPPEAPAPYDFQYKVDNPPTNTYFGHNEQGDQSGRVTGSYYVYLPDGRLMTVDYSVDGQSGFVPRITFQENAIPQG